MMGDDQSENDEEQGLISNTINTRRILTNINLDLLMPDATPSKYLPTVSSQLKRQRADSSDVRPLSKTPRMRTPEPTDSLIEQFRGASLSPVVFQGSSRSAGGHARGRATGNTPNIADMGELWLLL